MHEVGFKINWRYLNNTLTLIYIIPTQKRTKLSHSVSYWNPFTLIFFTPKKNDSSHDRVYPINQARENIAKTRRACPNDNFASVRGLLLLLVPLVNLDFDLVARIPGAQVAPRRRQIMGTRLEPRARAGCTKYSMTRRENTRAHALSAGITQVIGGRKREKRDRGEDTSRQFMALYREWPKIVEVVFTFLRRRGRLFVETLSELRKSWLIEVFS